jgi:hypothetical protein
MGISGEWGLVTAMTNLLVGDLFIQVLCYMLTKCGIPHDTGITSVIVFCVIQIIFNFYPLLCNRWESDLCSYDICDWEWH